MSHEGDSLLGNTDIETRTVAYHDDQPNFGEINNEQVTQVEGTGNYLNAFFNVL
jgi:hypothetical protein